jgi:glycosyltransferase involved in cell wall biosynthesis
LAILRSKGCLIFCTANHGGLADYAHAQAEALAARGHAVVLLAPRGFPYRSSSYRLQLLPVIEIRSRRWRWLQRLGTAGTILVQQMVLNQAIASSGCNCVLFTSYSEYLAPLWAWRLQCWQRSGLRFAAVMHDPVRNYVVGPQWWHRLSITQAFSFLSVALLHAPIQLNTGHSQPGLRTLVIPHGPFRYPLPKASAEQLRNKLAVPADVTLLLSFGHIRDNKNLQLVLQAMSHLPQIWLLVAGPEATSGQRPSAHYRRLAVELGVAERCLWEVGYQSPQEVADHFGAADAVLLTYAGSFHSASGVMHLAAHYRKPVIASAGASALLDTVRRFSLGEVVAPDDPESLQHGMLQLLHKRQTPDWQAYEQVHSWDRNAQLVAEALGLETAAVATT